MVGFPVSSESDPLRKSNPLSPDHVGHVILVALPGLSAFS